MSDSQKPAGQHFNEDTVRSNTSMKEMFSYLWPYFMKRKYLFFSTLVAVIAVAAAARLSVWLFGYAIDNGLIKNNRDVIVGVAVAYLLLEIGQCALGFIHQYFFAKIGNHVLFEIRSRLVSHVQSLPITYFEKNPTGRIVTRLTNDVVSMGELFTQGIVAIFSSLVTLISIVVAMSFISVKMTLVTLLIAPPLIWVVIQINRRLLTVLRESKAKLAAINAFVAENINGMRVLQLYGRVERNTTRFQELSAAYRDQQMKSVRMYALLWPTISFFNGTSVATALFIGGYLSLNDVVTTGATVAFILHVRAFTDPLHTILEKYQNLQNSLSGAERVITLLEENQENLTGREAPLVLKPSSTASIARRPDHLKGEVVFDRVGFKYGEKLPLVLDEINLKVEPGQSVALVGRTGSGKSTMIALLQRFYEPVIGEIRIDGVKLSEIAAREIRSRIGVVQQDTFMFRGTIAENISLRDPSVTREAIEKAAEIACLGEILERHSGGLEAKVEERGANLSVGERQLIAFARILAFDPDILILDEATANIDSRTEKLIQEATHRVRQGRTSFIIAHRISTVLDCDKIVVLDKGRIVESGTHRELFARDGMYRALCKSQFNEGIDFAKAELGAT